MQKLTRHFATAIFIVHQSKVLLVFHRKLKKWLPPGGHVDEHELPDKAALREVKEEVGLDVRLLSFSNHPAQGFKTTRVLAQPFHINVHKISKDHEHIGFVYFAKLDGKKFKVKSSKRELTKYKWYTAKQLKSLSKIPDDVKFSAKQAIEFLQWFP